jgi:site-specific DNA-methyltransferase (adenine-specific)
MTNYPITDSLTYQSDSVKLYCTDTLKLLQTFPNDSIDMIFADPPYFLSNGGVTCISGKFASVNKGNWDSGLTLQERHEFNRNWISLCYGVLKDQGTIWVSGTFHNIYSIGMALEESGFQVINNITWQKTNPPPNLACKSFTHSTETILWAKKRNAKKSTFNYSVMKTLNNNKQMKDVWTGTTTPQKEKKLGKHPAQKPEYILDRIILASTNEGDIILDPFCGSGTTGVVASRLHRKFIGIDSDKSYLDITKRRIEETHEA